MALTQAQINWVLDNPAARVSTVYLPAHNGLQSRYLSTDFYVTDAQSSLGGVVFEPRIVGGFEITRDGSGFLMGSVNLSDVSTNIILNNADKRIGAWVSEGWEGRPVQIRWGDPAWDEFTDHILDIDGQVLELLHDGEHLRLVIRDLLNALDKDFPTDTYDTGASEGESKVYVFGDVRRAEAKEINSNTLVYACSENGGTVQNVYDRGVLLTNGPDWVAVDDGDSRHVDIDNILGKVTHDTLGATDPDHDVSTVLEAYLLAVGLTAGQIDSSALAAMAGGADRDVGLYLDQPASVKGSVNMLAQSVGAMVFPTRDQAVSAVQIKIAQGNPQREFTHHDIQGGVTVSLATEAMPGIRIGQKIGFTTHDRDALSAVSKFDLTQQARTLLTREVNKITINEPDGSFDVLETLLVDGVQAQAEGARHADILKYSHHNFSFRTLRGGTLVDVGQEIRVAHEFADVLGLGFLEDDKGLPIQDQNGQAIEFGRDMLVRTITDERPFGAARIVGWV